MDDQNSLHRELKEQEFSTRSGSRGSRVRDRDRYGRAAAHGVEEEQQIAVLGEVVVVAESLVSGGVAVELRWSCSGVVELRRRAATPGLAAAAAGDGEGAVYWENGSARPCLLRAVVDALYRSGGNGAGSR